MDTKETKKGIEKKAFEKESKPETETRENLKDVLAGQEEIVEADMKSLEKSGEKDIEAIEKSGDNSDVTEMKKGVGGIRQEAAGAKAEYSGTISDFEKGKKTRQEVINEIDRINQKIDKGYETGLAADEVKELKDRREKLFSLLDGHNKDDFGTEIGKKLGPEKPKLDSAARINKGDKNAVEVIAETATNEISDAARKRIMEELHNKDSSLSKTIKGLKEAEEYIEKMKAGLKELEAMKESDKRNKAIEIHKASLSMQKAELIKLTAKLNKITANFEEGK